MKKSLMLFSTLVAFAMIASCSSESEDDLVTDDNPGNGAVTYESPISAVIGSNCLGCHGSPTANGAPFSLTTFSDVSSRANTILTAISRQTGETRAMPPAGRLPQSTIDLFEEWIDAGTPEN
ncbi:hypothetical protein [Flagellimonas sp. 2504JD4-2]